jgi:hypothetical protein
MARSHAFRACIQNSDGRDLAGGAARRFWLDQTSRPLPGREFHSFSCSSPLQCSNSAGGRAEDNRGLCSTGNKPLPGPACKPPPARTA